MANNFKIDLTSRKLIDYTKLVLVLLLIAIEIVICAQTFGKIIIIYSFSITLICCVLLIALEAVNAFVIKNFAAKMVFYGLDSALLLVICILTGNSYLSILYCIVLTQCYLSVERFRDKTILFGVSCGIFVISFIAGCLISNPTMNEFDIITGALFGLGVIALDYIVAIFLLKFYRTNLELRLALKEADESRAQLKGVYEELTKTKVYEERNRIAREIHDTAGHSMTTVIMQTEAAKLIIDENPAEAKNRIISANVQARNALEQMRESVHLLAGRGQVRPLKEELEEVFAQTIDGTDVKVRYDLDISQPSQEVYRFIVNTVKELLANGIRHGNATAFYVELKESERFITLLVSDNGAGVKGEIKEGFGLKGIREKAATLNGRCCFTSEEGEGFEVKITFEKEHGND